MARTNPQVEALQRENAVLRKWIDSMRTNPGDCPLVACDNSCVCVRPEGMATNGGCRCDERKLRRAVQWWKRVAEFRLITIREMRDGEP